MDPDRAEIRVLGALIEKQRTTPDAYPLTLNALRLACNQSTNRDPVLELSDSDVRAALERLARRGWTRSTSWAGSRSMKYKHLLDDALSLSRPQLALLGVLMLRGAQTPGELKGRSERQHSFASLEDVQGTLDALVESELAIRLPRRPGQKEERYEQLLGGDAEVADAAAAMPADRREPPSVPRIEHAEGDEPPGRLAALEARVGELEEELRRLREELGA